MANLSCRNYPTQKGLCLRVFTHKLTKINNPVAEDAHKNKPCLLKPSLLDEIPIFPNFTYRGCLSHFVHSRVVHSQKAQ